MLGKARASSIRVMQVFCLGVSPCAWVDDDRRVGVVWPFSWLGNVGHPVSWHTLRLDGRHWRTPIAAWWGLPLFGRFLVDEVHYVRVTGGWWGVTGPRSAGIRLDLIQKPRPLFSFSRRYFDAYHVWVARESNYRTWQATLSTGPRRDVLYVSRRFRPEITSRPTRALYRRAVPFTESISDHRMTTDVRDHKHFFCAARQIPFFEGAMFLVETHTIAHSTFGRWDLGVQTRPVESIPHVGHRFGGDLVRGHANTAMIGVIVRMDQGL